MIALSRPKFVHIVVLPLILSDVLLLNTGSPQAFIIARTLMSMKAFGAGDSTIEK